MSTQEIQALQARQATLRRQTGETDIKVSVNLDGQGSYNVVTGNGFLDHMVNQLARHGLFDITLKAQGDVHTGWHHLVEDVAIVPLDETLAMVVVDWSGRGYAVVETTLDELMVETLSGDLIKHFLEAFAIEGRINLHAKILAGTSPHHKAEALFKALARALRDAVELDPRAAGQVPSTKGTLDG
jgi:imidazoleglycerol-phosphate dehydratase